MKHPLRQAASTRPRGRVYFQRSSGEITTVIADAHREGGSPEWAYGGKVFPTQTALAESLGITQDLLSAAIIRSSDQCLDAIIDTLLEKQKRIEEISDVAPSLRDAIIKNPSQSVEYLASRYALNRETVRNRIKDLYALGVISVLPKSNTNAMQIRVFGKTFASELELAREYRIPYSRLTDRYHKETKKTRSKGIPFDEEKAWEYAITLGPDQRNRKPLTDTSGKHWSSQRKAAHHHNVSFKTLNNRLSFLGWRIEAALTPIGRVKEPVRSHETYYLYWYIHKSTGKAYFGITIDVQKRHNSHLSAASRRKYSTNSFDEALALEGEGAFDGPHKNSGGAWNSGLGRMVEMDDLEFSSVASFARHCGVTEPVMRSRLTVLDWTPKQAAGIEPRPQTTQPIPTSFNGEKYPSHSAAERDHDLAPGAIRKQRELGHSDAQILGEEPIDRSYLWENKLMGARKCRFKGVDYKSVKQACKDLKFCLNKIYRLIRKENLSIEAALQQGYDDRIKIDTYAKRGFKFSIQNVDRIVEIDGAPYETLKQLNAFLGAEVPYHVVRYNWEKNPEVIIKMHRDRLHELNTA